MQQFVRIRNYKWMKIKKKLKYKKYSFLKFVKII